jgi:5,5'-dehydrodivanillate O-demethylase oxygenase subunit
MFTKEENARATAVGPGTPGGEMLRRYWFPVGGIHELTETQPTKFVRLLGENLVLFKDKSGNVGLLADHCAHRGASLLYGRVEERGIACAYHGWLYDTIGDCLECPAEPAGSRFHLTVKQRAYPVQELFGLYWAYLGPAPAPSIRKLDIMEYPVDYIRIENEFQANWVQVMENNLDGSHIFVLHQDTYVMHREADGRQHTAASTTRGLIDDLAELTYREVPAGIMRTIAITDGYVEEDLLIFPNMLRRMNTLSIKAPTDDTHTMKYVVAVRTDREGPDSPAAGGANGYRATSSDAKSPMDAAYPAAQYRMDRLPYQDMMAIESQGGISPRDAWHLGTKDDGVAQLDRMILREIDRVAQGLDPKGTGAEARAIVDTNFDAIHVVGLR